MLIDPEPGGALVQRHGVRPDDPFHPGASLPPELQVSGLDSAAGGDQVGYLLLGAAGTAPGPDVIVCGRLHAVLDLADPGEVLAGRRCQRPSRQARVLADLPEACA